jgi:hypothetical protein
MDDLERLVALEAIRDLARRDALAADSNDHPTFRIGRPDWVAYRAVMPPSATIT